MYNYTSMNFETKRSISHRCTLCINRAWLSKILSKLVDMWSKPLKWELRTIVHIKCRSYMIYNVENFKINGRYLKTLISCIESKHSKTQILDILLLFVGILYKLSFDWYQMQVQFYSTQICIMHWEHNQIHTHRQSKQPQNVIYQNYSNIFIEWSSNS